MRGSISTPSAACNGCSGCLPVAAARASKSERLKPMASYASLVALLIPGVGFGIAVALVPKDGRFAALTALQTVPWELWIIALAGGLATLGGLADWAFHRWVFACKIGRAERRCELIALAAGGAPMFALMLMASVAARPVQYLPVVFVLLLFTTVLICYDEFVFHARRCKALETLFHRILVFGNGFAFLAWAHWCFVREHALAG
jgi:hypothetical protein